MPLKHIFLQSYANTRISVFNFSKSTTKFWHFTFLFVFHLPLSPYITPFPFQNLLTLCLKIFWDEISFTYLHIHGVKNKQLSVAIIKQEQSQQMQLAQCCCHSFWSSENSKNKIIYFKKQKPRTLNYYCCIPTVRSGCIPPCYVPWLPSEGKVDTGAGRGWNTAQPSTAHLACRQSCQDQTQGEAAVCLVACSERCHCAVLLLRAAVGLHSCQEKKKKRQNTMQE